MKFSYKHSMDIAKIPYHSYAKRKVYLDIQGTMDYISKKVQVQRLPDKIDSIGQVEDILHGNSTQTTAKEVIFWLHSK